MTGRRRRLTSRRGVVVLSVAAVAAVAAAAAWGLLAGRDRPDPRLQALCQQSAHDVAVQVLHVVPADVPASAADPKRIARAVADADHYLAASGPGHRIKWACEGGELDVATVPVPAREVAAFAALVGDVRAAGHERSDRLYALFYPPDAGYAEVGEATGSGDRSAGPQYAMMTDWSGYWTLHELGHALGAVPFAAPHQRFSGHCLEQNDVMCRRVQDLDDPTYADIVQYNCPDAPEWLFDCNHDDYYLHDGEWWDVADSPYLYRADPEHRPSPVPRGAATSDPGSAAAG